MKNIFTLKKVLSLLLVFVLLFCTVATQIQTFATNTEETSSISIPVDGSSTGTGTRNVTVNNLNVDASALSNPHIQLSVYIARDDDASSVEGLLKWYDIELTSSGRNDKAEIAWGKGVYELKAGWNTLCLPFSDAKATDGGSKFDISSISYFRMYHTPTDNSVSYTLKVKDVSIVDKTETTDDLKLDIDGSSTGTGTRNITKSGLNVDASDLTNPHLQMSVYIARDDVSSVEGLLKWYEIELTSSGQPDKAEIAWGKGVYDLKAGWNTLCLPFSDAKATDGGSKFDISSIKYFRMYHTPTDNSVSYTLKVKDVSIVDKTETTDDLKLDIDGSSTGTGTRNVTKSGFSVDASKLTNPHLQMSVYIARDDVSSVEGLLKWYEIELTSSGQPDKAEIAWGKGIYELKAGWNTLCLPFSDAKATDGGSKFDISSINYFRMYHTPSDNTVSYTLKVKDVSIVDKTEAADDHKLDIDGSSTGTGTRNVTKSGFSVDASELTNPHLQMSVYIARDDDVSSVEGLLKWYEIELTSSGTNDKAEIAWGKGVYELKAGWNTLCLPFSDAKATDGGSKFDISSINYFRMYHTPTDNSVSYTLKVKDVSIIEKEGGQGDNDNDSDIEDDDSIIKGSSKGTGTLNVTCTDFNLDLSSYVNPHLQISIYIARNDDAESVEGLLKWYDIELTSSGQPDKAEIAWGKGVYELKAGWNTLCLSFMEAKSTDSGAKFDLSAINYFRMYHTPADNSVSYSLKVKEVSIVDKPKEPDYDDPNLILNDEKFERAWPASIKKDVSKVGSKCYSATTYVTDKGFNEGWLIRMGFWGNPMNRTMDITKTTANGTKGAIRFWVYAENAEEIRKLAAKNSGSYCRYGSTSSWDKNLFEWRGWANQIITDGWNEIVLPFENATKVGEPDLTNMSSFGLKFGDGKLEEVPRSQIYIDDIRISENTKTALPISWEPTISGAKMFQPFDEMTGMNKESKMTAFELDLKEKTQGMASLKYTTEAGTTTWVYRAGNKKVDATGYNALEFDLYVSNPEFFEYAGGALELTSSGKWDQNEIQFDFKTLKLKKGWNHIVFSFDYATYTKDFKGNPDIDLSAVNFMRLYTGKAEKYVGKEIEFRLDNMCFTKNGEAKVEKTVVVTNDSGYELYLTAKPDVIPSYGEIVVKRNNVTELPETVKKMFAEEKDTVIITPTFYKDSIEYHFNDSVTVHLSQEKLPSFKNKYVYRLDVNDSFEKISRIDNKSKKELVWEEPSRLTTYIISDVLIEDEVLNEANKQTEVKNQNNENNTLIIIGVTVSVLVVIAGGTTVAIVLKKRKRKINI